MYNVLDLFKLATVYFLCTHQCKIFRCCFCSYKRKQISNSIGIRLCTFTQL